MLRTAALLLGTLLALGACSKTVKGPPPPRQIHLVGSAAVYPFSAAVAERFMREETDSIAPLAQADGTGSGIARFCAGLGPQHPDIVGVTRMMTADEQATCARNAVGAIEAIPFGWSALVLVTRTDTPSLPLTRATLWHALSGPSTRWSEIDPTLPPIPVVVHGPTPQPALADGLYDLLLIPGCHAAGGTACETAKVRRDGAYHPHGADAALVADVVRKTPGAIGILPWADAVAHRDGLRLLTLDDVMPDAATITSGRYPARMPMILYIKPHEVPEVPGLATLLGFYAQSWAAGGDFAQRGLLPLTPSAQAKATDRIAAFAHPGSSL